MLFVFVLGLVVVCMVLGGYKVCFDVMLYIKGGVLLDNDLVLRYEDISWQNTYGTCVRCGLVGV